MMTCLVAAIVGLGPRGLTILDRLVEAFRWKQPQSELVIHLIEPGEEGQGVHRANLPDHLLVNTPGRMITMFPHDAINGAPARVPGPSLPEWVRMQGYRRVGARYAVGDVGEEISDEDYLPRRLLGEYLSWYFHQTLRNLPKGLTVIRNRLRATDIVAEGRDVILIEFETGYRMKVDFVFLATGHGSSKASSEHLAFERFVQHHADRNENLLFLREPYPLERLAVIGSETTVALQGSGLAAHDVIAELTVGRGGSFVAASGGLNYSRSGREPRISLFSRSGLPFSARAINQKTPGVLHKGRFFHPEAIRQLRNSTAGRRADDQLDFDRDVFPLMIKEMACAYTTAKRGYMSAPTDDEPSKADLDIILDAMQPLRGAKFDGIKQFRRFIFDYLCADLREAESGNLVSPIKAAVEVIRDSRESLRLAVEFRGLTPESHRRFDRVHQPMMNRLAFGPPMQRNQELLALIDAGVVEIAAGPDATISTDPQSGKFVVSSTFEREIHHCHADALILGRLDTFRPEQDYSMLYANLLARGIVRPFRNGDYHPFGIDIDPDGHPLMSSGTPLRNVWAVGYPVEGAHFFTHALPLPLLKSRHIMDADRCVLQLFQQLESRSPDHVRARHSAPPRGVTADPATVQ